MTTPRADKAKDTPPKGAAKPTTYEISRLIPGDPIDAAKSPIRRPNWEPVGRIETTGGAHKAIREWAEGMGEGFTGGTVRAVPTSYITEAVVQVETKRQLTLGMP